MPPSLVTLSNRWAANALAWRDALRLALIAVPHLAALAIMVWSEETPLGSGIFLLSWALLNFLWLAILRRPAIAGALSLLMIIALCALSRLKYDMIWMTANFFDLLLIDAD